MVHYPTPVRSDTDYEARQWIAELEHRVTTLEDGLANLRLALHVPSEIEARIRARRNALFEGDTATAEQIRRLLSDHGVLLVDAPDGTGTSWHLMAPTPEPT